MQNIRILNYENRSEKCVIKPVQFLRFIKKTDRSTCCITRYDFLSQTQKINMRGVVAYLSEIQVIGTKKRQVVNKFLPTLTPATDLIKPLLLDFQNDLNISHFVLVHPDRIWVCTYNNLFWQIQNRVLYSRNTILCQSSNIFLKHLSENTQLTLKMN